MLRERLQQVSEHPNDYFHRYRMFEALVEAVEPEDTTLAEAQERLEVRRSICESWEGRCHRTERERDGAQAEIERLREERDEARLRLAKWLDAHVKLVVDAEVGRLVRGMRPGSTLECDPNRLSALRWWGLNSHPYICQRTANPAEALRAIQEEGDDEM